MQTLRVRTRSDADRILHLDIPVGVPDATYDVVVVPQPRSDIAAPTTPEERGRPAGFFEATAGAWEGDFIRDQGRCEEREEF